MATRTALLKRKLSSTLPLLNERQRRLFVAAESRAWGWGGTETLARITGMGRPTIRRGLRELAERHRLVGGRVRRTGGGRRRLTHRQPRLKAELKKLLEPATRGDPQSPLLWVAKSTRHLAQALHRRGLRISHATMATLLKEMGYSLQANRKTKEGNDHPDRDRQFRYIHDSAVAFLKRKAPVVSVDTKRKELVGNYKNPGREWQKAGQPIEVKVHDFIDPKVPKAVPYGVYDINDNKGWVNVGTSSDTAEFAVDSIRYW